MASATYVLAMGAAVLLAGCAAMPEQTQQIGDASKQCKIVLVDTTSQAIRGYTSDMHARQSESNTSTEQAYAVGQVGKAQVFNPRFRMGHNEPNNIAQARNDC